jgi:membrane-associated phospholipid phosphatase
VPWPPSSTAPSSIYRATSTTLQYPDLAWDASLYGLTVLAEFVQPALNWASATQISAPPTGTAVTGPSGELDELARLGEYRAEALSEAIAQSTDMVGYWAGLLMFSPYSHPYTFRVARTAIVVGEFVVMHYKRLYQRPRPSQLSPALMPPIPIPGHASYPSGHATQAYLLSLMLGQVMPGVVSTTLTSGPGAPASLLDRLAERVARNREVLGVHYRSDSVAGLDLAKKTFAILQQCPSLAATTDPKGAFALAKSEWPS